MHMISAGGLHGKGFRGHADRVSMKSRVEIMAIHYCMLELVFKVPSHTGTVHVAEDASESALVWYPGVLSVLLYA